MKRVQGGSKVPGVERTLHQTNLHGFADCLGFLAVFGHIIPCLRIGEAGAASCIEGHRCREEIEILGTPINSPSSSHGETHDGALATIAGRGVFLFKVGQKFLEDIGFRSLSLGSVPPNRTAVFLGKDHDEVANLACLPGRLVALHHLRGGIAATSTMQENGQRIRSLFLMVVGGQIQGVDDFIPGKWPLVSEILLVIAFMNAGTALSLSRASAKGRQNDERKSFHGRFLPEMRRLFLSRDKIKAVTAEAETRESDP